MQLQESFKGTIRPLCALLLQNIAEAEKDLDMEQINTLYGASISLNEGSGEALIWAQKWRSSTTRRVSVVQVVSLSPKALHPNGHCLLKIMARLY